MSDVLFQYLLMARQRDRAAFRRYFARDDQLLEAGVEELIESAAARVVVRSQLERTFPQNREAPASHRSSIRFYDKPRPERPQPERVEDRAEEFPLSASCKVATCRSCLGTAKTACHRCRGQGNVACWRCRGSGRSSVSSGPGSGSSSCRSCGGGGSRRCSSCRGDGSETCTRCQGEGRTVRWTSQVYTWRIVERSEVVVPNDDPRLVAAFRRWLEIDPERVADLEPATAVAHLGFESPEALEIVARADASRRRLEDEGRQSSDRLLFVHADCSLAPVAYAQVRRGDAVHFYGLVGRGDEAQAVEPGKHLDRVKVAGWLGLSSGGLVAWEVAARWFESAGLAILDSLQVLGGAPPFGLLGVAAASSLLTLIGARRMLASPPPVRTIGLLPASGEPTSWLICLAYLGCYTRRLTVLDRAYDAQLERLVGRQRSRRQSEGLLVRLKDGRRLRLIEVADPARLSDDQLGLALKALDGVLILEERGPAADALEDRLRMIAGYRHRPAKRCRTSTGRSRVDMDPAADLVSSEALPLEAIRRTFVEDIEKEIDWEALFERLWQPIEKLQTRR